MQYSISFPEAGDTLALRLGELGLPAQVVLTDNVRTILSIRRGKPAASLRVHRCFASAPDEVVDALARFIRRGDKAARAEISRFFRAQPEIVSHVPRRRAMDIRPSGEHHDLAEILSDISRRFFDGAVGARITWGRGRLKRPRRGRRSRHITLGSYSSKEKLIVIHPNLDRPRVPRRVVESIVFHEICHEVAGEAQGGKRRRLHTREFRELERGYPHFAQAGEWVRKNLDYLLKNELKSEKIKGGNNSL
ncbi:MAG: hypothetical protein V2A66_01740 [Pseudomonadota bacterium]